MINRQNWLDTKEFLTYYERIGREEASVKRVRGMLRHLLEWADEKPFGRAREIDPAYQTYLLTARADGKGERLSPASMKKACEYARVFFGWIRNEHPARYRNLSTSWIETVRPGTSRSLHSRYHEHQFWSEENILKIAALTPANPTEERDQAAVCFLFLSAMRAQAFVSMPVAALNLQERKVKQFPELGVHTKNGKAEITSMLRIPELMEVVEAWDQTVREAGAALWYPRIDRWHRFLEADGADLNWESRTKTLNCGIRILCKKADVPYLSSHKLRHGHTVYAMKRVKDMKQLKTLSQNLMHSSVAITDGIYGRLVSDDIASLYDNL